TMPKYVVSSTLQASTWSNSTILKGDVIGEVTKLKQQLRGAILIPGSIQLVRTLIEHDLADELRLTIYPVVLGDGERLFGGTSDKKSMRLIDRRTLDNDLVYLTYQWVATPSGPASPGV